MKELLRNNMQKLFEMGLINKKAKRRDESWKGKKREEDEEEEEEKEEEEKEKKMKKGFWGRKDQKPSEIEGQWPFLSLDKPKTKSEKQNKQNQQKTVRWGPKPPPKI